MEYAVVISEWFDETVFAWTDLVGLATNSFCIIWHSSSALVPNACTVAVYCLLALLHNKYHSLIVQVLIKMNNINSAPAR